MEGMKLREWWDGLLRLLFPPGCVSCGELLERGGDLLCENCRKRFEAERKEQCPICHAPHGECRCMIGKTAQRHLSDYLSPVTRSLVLSGKDRNNRVLAEFWAKELARQLRREPSLLYPDVTVLCYVPRNPVTVRLTGTDQSRLLAEKLAEELHLPLLPAILRSKEKKTVAQKHLSAAARQRAAASHYRFHRKAVQKSDLFGKTVLLVDDVITTGATVNACADLLRKHGAAFVCAVAPAKTGYSPFRWNLVPPEEATEWMPESTDEEERTI